jgi:hypothetical protein
MRVPMSLWTSCLRRDCLTSDLRQRRRYGYPAGPKRCSVSLKDGCDGRAAPSLFPFGRKSALATTALAAILVTGTANHAGATVWSNFTNSGFVTMSPGNSALTFTFDGKSASNTDNMDIILSNSTEHFIVSNNAAAGTTVTVTGLTPGHTYGLELIDTANGEHWSSDPAKDGTTVGSVSYTSDLINSSGDSCSHGNSCAQAPHLAVSTSWSSFGLGGSAPGAPGSTYYGWEDLPLADHVQDADVNGGVVTQITTSGDNGDYNDLVFRITQSDPAAPVSEPASFTLLCAGLLGIRLMRRGVAPR